jgi:hypothetical protein
MGRVSRSCGSVTGRVAEILVSRVYVEILPCEKLNWRAMHEHEHGQQQSNWSTVA